MGLAAHLGVGDLESPLLQAARHAWTRWCTAYPELAVVEELSKLPEWTRHATRVEKDAVLARLAALTAHDADARTTLVWLLVPGANKLANDLRDLHPDIDGMVAGQLWIEVSRASELSGRGVAAATLRCTRREVCVELGVGDLAKRRDRVWAEAVCVADSAPLACARDDYESPDELVGQVERLELDAMEANAINTFDAWLLDQLAIVAARLEVPGHRGRMGLTTPAVVDELGRIVHLSPRAIRRRATTALDRLAEYVKVRDDPSKFAVWRAQHLTCPVTPAEEMQLVITDECDAHFFRVRDLPPGAWAPDVSLERRRPATG